MSTGTLGGMAQFATAASPARESTVGEILDIRIAKAREQVEKLCMIKAKAEAMQMLNHPIQFIADICHG